MADYSKMRASAVMRTKCAHLALSAGKSAPLEIKASIKRNVFYQLLKCRYMREGIGTSELKQAVSMRRNRVRNRAS